MIIRHTNRTCGWSGTARKINSRLDCRLVVAIAPSYPFIIPAPSSAFEQ
jgi:hypothetical protein